MKLSVSVNILNSWLSSGLIHDYLVVYATCRSEAVVRVFLFCMDLWFIMF